ncbi:MAG: SH3 domain-containing protein [Roseibium sp.]
MPRFKGTIINSGNRSACATKFQEGRLLYVPAHAKAYDLQTAGAPNTSIGKPATVGAALKTPGLKALLVSSVLVAVAGGGAFALGLNDLIGDQRASTRLVQTGAIAPENAASVQDAGNSTKIVKNTDRMRQTFVAGAQQKSSIVFTPGAKTTFSSKTSGQMALNLLAPRTVKLASAQPTNIRPVALSHQQPELPAPAQDAEQSPTAIVTASVNMRRASSSRSKIIGVLQQGTEVSYGDCSKYWCEVDVDGKTGFVSQKYVKR